MPRHFQSPKSQYRNVDEFKQRACHTLISLWGKHKKFLTFDFQEKDVTTDGTTERFYVCIGYQEGDQVPPEATRGTPVTEAQAEQERKVEAIQIAADEKRAAKLKKNRAPEKDTAEDVKRAIH